MAEKHIAVRETERYLRTITGSTFFTDGESGFTIVPIFYHPVYPRMGKITVDERNETFTTNVYSLLTGDPEVRDNDFVSIDPEYFGGINLKVIEAVQAQPNHRKTGFEIFADVPSSFRNMLVRFENGSVIVPSMFRNNNGVEIPIHSFPELMRNALALEAFNSRNDYSTLHHI